MRVSPEELAKICRDVVRTGRPYSSRDLDGAVLDCDYGLDVGGFTSAKATKTGVLERMVAYRCRPNWEPQTTDEVVARLEEAWITQGAFSQDAHAVTATRSEITLDFVTCWNDGRFYTGRIEVAMQVQPKSDT